MKKNPVRKYRFSLALMFSGIVLAVLLLTSVIVAVVVFYLVYRGTLKIGDNELDFGSFILVMTLLSLGIELLGLDVNADLNTAKQAAASCFLPASYEQPQSSTNFSVEALTERIDKEMAHNQLSLLRLCELDRSLRQQDVDEPRLLAQLKNEKRLGLFRSLLAILHEQTGLDEGFMPCKPKYDRKTKKIRNSIKHHLSLL